MTNEDLAIVPVDRELLGLSIDMLDAERLRIWAEKIETHGADISHWSSPAFVVKELLRVADGIAAAVKDIGTLRLAAAPVPCAASPADPEKELARIKKLAKVFRLEDVLNDPMPQSELVQKLRAFEIAAALRIELDAVKRELATLRATGEGARDDRHEDRGIGSEGGQPDDRATADDGGADGASGEARSGADLRGARVRSAAASEPPAPIAVSLDPHRLLDLEPYQRKLDELRVEGEKHLAHCRATDDDHKDGPEWNCPACDDIFGLASALKDLLGEIARLRGEATVPAPFLCDGCGEPVTVNRDMTTYHRKCDPAAVRVEE